MQLYHGSNFEISEFKTPDTTGIIRHGEEKRESFRDMVFFTADITVARKYGKYVYVCEVNNPLDYKEEYIRRISAGEIKTKKKKGNCLKKLKSIRERNIFVSKSSDIKIKFII